jgi:hypothetical protein
MIYYKVPVILQGSGTDDPQSTRDARLRLQLQFIPVEKSKVFFSRSNAQPGNFAGQWNGRGLAPVDCS